MEKQRRNVLKRILLSVTGAAGFGLMAKAGATPAPAPKEGQTAVPAEKEVFNVVEDQQVPLFSGATKFNGMIFIAGKGAHVEPFEIKAHTEIVLKELEKELIAAGSSMEKVLKVTVFLNDIADYA